MTITWPCSKQWSLVYCKVKKQSANHKSVSYAVILVLSVVDLCVIWIFLCRGYLSTVVRTKESVFVIIHSNNEPTQKVTAILESQEATKQACQLLSFLFWPKLCLELFTQFVRTSCEFVVRRLLAIRIHFIHMWFIFKMPQWPQQVGTHCCRDSAGLCNSSLALQFSRDLLCTFNARTVSIVNSCLQFETFGVSF